MEDDDKAANDDALVNGDRIMSSYTVAEGIDVWVITEATREVTTILLPEDY